MIATTGFQRNSYEKTELVPLFKNVLKNDNKFIEYTKSSLRSAKDIFIKGGHVTNEFKEQTFRLFYDNRRNIIEQLENSKVNEYDLSNRLLDSLPLKDSIKCKTLRFLSKFPITTPFNKNNTNRCKTRYNNTLEIAVRNFIKALHNTDERFNFNGERFGLKGNVFVCYNDLINFISDFKSTKDIKYTKQAISNLKNRKLF